MSTKLKFSNGAAWSAVTIMNVDLNAMKKFSLAQHVLQLDLGSPRV